MAVKDINTNKKQVSKGTIQIPNYFSLVNNITPIVST